MPLEDEDIPAEEVLENGILRTNADRLYSTIHANASNVILHEIDFRM